MRWTLKPEPDSKLISELSQSLSINSILAKILAQRGIKNFDEAKRFFRPSLEDLHAPFLLKDMDKAVDRIETAIKNKEQILIYGDYDVDGTTAASLVYTYLKEWNASVATYIPDRYEEGYGISYQGIDFAHDNDFTLVIALDCGIKAIDKIEYAKSKGIDFIICDHHKPGSNIPAAVAVLNPKREDCKYPFDELCGCGVGFKLIQALEEKRGGSLQNLIPYLDLVAIAIGADIVPITGENRILAYYGLQVINSNPRSGIRALINQVKKKELTITDVVFLIAPRINAAGRIEHGNKAVTLLTETNFEKSLEYAEEIHTFNADRKELDKLITHEALRQIEENNEQQNFSTVVYCETWHKGVIGIVASRLIETYYRPTLVFTKSGDKLTASARSVSGFDIYDALEACSKFIEQFGGHKYAAGLTILPENFQAFKKRFEEVVSKTITKDSQIPEICIDAEIDFSDITPKFFRIIQQMAPFGPKNMTPTFKTSAVRDNGFGRKVGADESHLKLNLFQADNTTTFNSIGFNLGNKISQTKNSFDIVYSLEENEWNGSKSIQLVLKDLQ